MRGMSRRTKGHTPQESSNNERVTLLCRNIQRPLIALASIVESFTEQEEQVHCVSVATRSSNNEWWRLNVFYNR